MKIIKFEQSGFIFESNSGFRLAVDIGNKTATSKLWDLPDVDLMIVSHIHGDHFDPDNIKALNPVQLLLDQECHIALPYQNATIIHDGFVFKNDHVSIMVFSVDHGPSVSVPVENYGFLITMSGQTIYFAGDMFYPSGIDVSELIVNFALIPVGTHYTFGPKEALDFLRHFKEARMVIPMHYANKPETKDEFIALASEFFVLDVSPEPITVEE